MAGIAGLSKLTSFRIADDDYASDVSQDWQDAQSVAASSFASARPYGSRTGSFNALAQSGTPPPAGPAAPAGPSAPTGADEAAADEQFKADQAAIDDDIKATRLPPPCELPAEELQATKRARSAAVTNNTLAASAPQVSAAATRRPATPPHAPPLVLFDPHPNPPGTGTVQESAVRVRLSSAGGDADAVQVVLQLARPTDEEVAAGSQPVFALGGASATQAPQQQGSDASPGAATTTTAAAWRPSDSASSPNFLVGKSGGADARSDQQLGAAAAAAPAATATGLAGVLSKKFPRSFSSAASRGGGDAGGTASKGLRSLFSGKFWTSSSAAGGGKKRVSADDLAVGAGGRGGDAGAASLPELPTGKAAAAARVQDVVEALADTAAREPAQVRAGVAPVPAGRGRRWWALCP